MSSESADAIGTGLSSTFSSMARLSGEIRSRTSSSSSILPPPSSPKPPPRPLPRDSLLLNNAPDAARRYFMDHDNRGIAVIINNQSFDKSLNLSKRVGSSVDAVALEDAFRTLRFISTNIHCYTDVSCRNMLKLMQHYATTDFTDMDCFVCAILSHGKDGGIVYGYDGKISIDSLMEPFKKKMHASLVGKPKVFLVQACRGETFDDGRDLTQSDDGEHVQRIPLEADFLYAYSTVPGYYAWRNAMNGSWFIQAIVKNIQTHKRNAEMDLLKLLTRVNYDVAYQYQSNAPDDPRMHAKKQMPSVVSMLTKDLCFFRS
ncbi:caspase-3-like [Paramacrobiotus metropolitanus]|uniref:caspase-3-like n=1 Tax=Paramacrobiotus metropolitanus TaxID=2943436 RepID=UPI0024464B04|nr:caspase-3-like [Paramacrobiotus metropolitanus]